MPELPLLARAELNSAQRALYDRIATGPRAKAVVPLTDDDGHLAGPFNALLYSPALGEAVQELGARIRFGTSLSDRERELATLLVAGRLGSTYELTAHRALARAAGLEPEPIEALARGELPDLADPRERAILRLCVTLLDDPGAATEADVDPHTLVELTILVGYYQLLARVLTVAGLD